MNRQGRLDGHGVDEINRLSERAGDLPTAMLAVVTVLLLWRFKKLQEPVIVTAAALIGLVAYPLIHSHAI